MATAEEILREAEEALEKEKESASALMAPEQILAEAEDVVERERMALPPVVPEKGTVAEPLTEAAKAEKAPPLPPNPEPEKIEAGKAPTADQMFKGAEISAPPKDWKAWMLPFRQEEPTKTPEIITQPKVEEPKQEISTKPLDIFLQLSANTPGYEMDSNLMDLRDSLSVEELAEAVKIRPDIPLNAKQEREVYDYIRENSAWRIPKNSEQWLNLGGAVAKFPIDMTVAFGETLAGVAKGAVKMTRDVALGEITGKDYNLAWQLHEQLPPRARERVTQRIGEYYPQTGYTGGGIEFTGKEYLDLVLEEYTPEQREQILATQQNVIERTKAAPMAFVAPAVDLPYQLAKLGQKMGAGGIEGWDLLSESVGLNSYDTSFERWKARKNFEGAAYEFESLNPTAYHRYLDFIAPAVNAAAASSIGTVEDYMRDNNFTREQAIAARQDDIEAMTIGGLEGIAEAKKLIPELDPDILTAGEILLPEGFGLDAVGYGMNLLKLGSYATPKVANYLRFRGKTPDEVNRILAEDAAKLRSKQQANFEATQRVTKREKAAIGVDESLKRAQEAIDRSNFFKRIRQISPYVAGAGIGYGLEPDSPLGVIGGLIGARMLKSTPEFIRNYYEARRLSAGGQAGTFETMAKLRRDRQAGKGAPRAEGGEPIRVTPIKGGLSDRLTSSGGKRLDSIIDNTREYIRAGVEPTLVGLAVGIADSQDAEEMAAMLGQGLLWSSLGRTQTRFMNKVFGMDDPVYDARRRRKEDADAWKAYQDLSPVDRGNVDALTDWQVVVRNQQQRVDQASKLNQAAVASNNPDLIAATSKNLANNQRALERMKRANVQTRNEFGRQYLLTLAGIHNLANGGFVRGQNNVGIRLLSTQQIKDHLRAKYPSESEDVINNYAEQDGFYDGTIDDTVMYGGIPKFRGPKIVMDDAKPTMVINTDAVIRRINNGQDPLTALRHEAGHHLSKIPEYQQLMAEPYRILFKEQIKNADEQVVAEVGEGLTEAELADLYVNKYAGTAVNPEFFLEAVAQRDPDTNAVLRDPTTGQILINQKEAAAKLREEITADLAADSMSRVFGKAPTPVIQALFDKATLAFKRNKFEMLSKKLSDMKRMLNIPDSQDIIYDNSGAKFTPEVQLLAREALEAMIDLQGQLSPTVKGKQAPKISRSEIMSNKALLETFGTYSPLPVTEVQAQIIGPDGNAIGAPQVLSGPLVYEGSWDVTEGGIQQSNGYGPISAEINLQGVPVGSKIIVARQVATQPDGVTPRFHQPKEAKRILKQRNKLIQEALDTPDYGAPNRFDPTKEGGETMRGTLSPLQVEAIKNLPETLLPKRIKDVILSINDALVRNDGSRFLINYAAMMNERGEYEAFSPKYYDLVPIGLMMSKAGNFLFTAISAGRMYAKLDAWGDRMPARLMPWKGSKEQFWSEFTNKYLYNWQQGLPGSGYTESGQVAGPNARLLDADPQVAAMKRNVFNDFLNLFDTATEGANPDRTKVPRRKGDPRDLNMDRTIMSVRIDHIAQIAPTSFPKMPIAYGLAKANFMPQREGGIRQPETVEEQGFRMSNEQRERLRVLEEEEKALGDQFAEAYGQDYANELQELRDLREAAAFMPMRPRRELTIDERVYPGFKSQLEDVVDQKIQGASASPEQIRAIISNPQNGIKPAEVEWSGINEAIDTLSKGGKNVNKADLMEYLRQNNMKFMLSTLGGQESVNKAISWQNMAPAGKRLLTKLDGLFDKYIDLDNEARKRVPELVGNYTVKQNPNTNTYGIYDESGNLWVPPFNVANFPVYYSKAEAVGALKRSKARQPSSVIKNEVIAELEKQGWNLDRYAVLKTLQALDDFGPEEAERWSRLTAEAADETAARLGDKRDTIANREWERLDTEYLRKREEISAELAKANNSDIATAKAMRAFDEAAAERDSLFEEAEAKLIDLEHQVNAEERKSQLYWRINGYIKDPINRIYRIGELGIRRFWPAGMGGYGDRPYTKYGDAGYRVLGDTNYREKILQVRPKLEVVKYKVKKRPKTADYGAGKYEIDFAAGRGAYSNLQPPQGLYETRAEAERVARSLSQEGELDFQFGNRGRAEGLEFGDTHYENYPYYIAHMRVGDRMIVDPTLRTIPEIGKAIATDFFGEQAPDSYKKDGQSIPLDSLGPAVKNGKITPQEADFYAAYRQWTFTPNAAMQNYGGTGTSHLVPISHIHEMQSDRNQAARRKDSQGNPIGYRTYTNSYEIILNIDGGPDIKLKRDFDRIEDAEQYMDEYLLEYGQDKKLQQSIMINAARQAGVKLPVKGGVLDTTGLNVPQIKLRVQEGDRIPNNAEAPPEAPFSQSRDWGMALIKNQIVDAVKSGHKYVYWSGGETQAKRWRDMAPIEKLGYKSVLDGDQIEIMLYPSSAIYTFMTVDPKTREIIYNENSPGMSRYDFKGKSLNDIIPKSMADEIIAKATPDQQIIKPKRNSSFFGGTKFKPYYDKIAVNEVNKFLKKYGSKVFPFQIPKPSQQGDAPPVYLGMKDPRDPVDPTAPDKAVEAYQKLEKAVGEAQKQEKFDYLDADNGWIFPITPALADAVRTNSLPTFMPKRELKQPTSEEGFYSQLGRVLDSKIQGKTVTAQQALAMLGEYIVTEDIEVDGKKKTTVVARVPADQKAVAEAAARSRAAEGAEVRVAWNSPNKIREDEVIFTDAVRIIQKLASQNDGKVNKERLIEHIVANRPTLISADGGDRYREYTFQGGDGYYETVLTMAPRPNREGKPLYDFRSGHYKNIPGYLAHARYKYRRDENGRLGIMVEEFQSDRAQRGRDFGWREEDPVKMIDSLNKWRLEAIYVSLLAQAMKTDENVIEEVRRSIDAYPLMDTNDPYHYLRMQADEMTQAEIRDAVKKMLNEQTEVRDPITNDSITLGQMTANLINNEIMQQDAKEGDFSGVPDMPFKRDWGLQLYKRILEKAISSPESVRPDEFDAARRKYIAYNDHYGPDSPLTLQALQDLPSRAVGDVEWIGWTKGVTQVERYQDMMRQVIDSIAYSDAAGPGAPYMLVYFYKNDPIYDRPIEPGEEGLYEPDVLQQPGEIGFAKVRKKDGVVLDGRGRIKDVLEQVAQDAKEGTRPAQVKLSEIIGKKMANDIIKNTGPSRQMISEADLTIGGEGMKGYYDLVQPSDIGKYMKPYGARVADTYLNIPEYARQGSDIKVRSDGKQYWVSTADNLKPISPRFETAAEALDFSKRLIEGVVPIWKVDLSPEIISRVEAEGQPQFMPQREPSSYVRFDGELDKKKGSWIARIRVVPGPDGNGAFSPELYFEGDTSEGSKLLVPPPLKTFEQAQAELKNMFEKNGLPMERFEQLDAPIVGTDRPRYKPGAWENTLRMNGFEDLIPSLEDQIAEQEMRDEARTPDFNRTLASSGKLLDDALNTRWLIKFANGEQAIEWGINKEAIVSLMKSRYGEQQWIEWVDSIDRIPEGEDPQSQAGFMPQRYERDPNLPEDDVLRRKDRFEADGMDLVNTPLTGLPMADLGRLDRSFHLTTIARRILNDFEPYMLQRQYKGFLERLNRGEIPIPDAKERAEELTKSIELNRTAMSYMMDLLSDLTASLPDITATDRRTGDKVDPYMVLKKHFPNGMQRPIDEILTEMSNVMSAVHPPAGTFPEGYNPGYSANNDMLNAAEVLGDVVDIDTQTLDLLHMRTMGKTLEQYRKDEETAIRELMNPEFNDVTEMEGGGFISRQIEPPEDTGEMPLMLPKRQNPPVADFTITKTGKVKLPKKTPKHGFFYGGLIDDTGTEILVKIDPNRVVEPTVKDLSDISGKRVGMVQADRHHTLGKDMGGPMHEFLISNQETVMGPDGILYKPVWGNLGLGPVNAMRNRLPYVDDGYHIVQIMADDAHRSNIAFGTDYIKDVDAFDKAGKLEPWVKDLAHVLLEIGNLRAQKIKAATRRAAKNRIRAEKGLEPIPAPPNTPEQDAIIAFNKALTPIKNRVAKNDPKLLATAKKEALKVYNAHKNKPWFKRLLKLGSNKNFLQEFLGYSFTARGEATKSVSGIPDLPNVVNALQDSEDMINATTGQAVAVIQLSSNPQAFALYFGNNPKQEAAMTPAEKKMRDTLLKNPKFKIHPSYPWVMLGPAKGNNFLIKTPTHLRKLFPNYEKQHKKLAANAKKGKPVTDNDVVGSMLKTPLPEIKIP